MLNLLSCSLLFIAGLSRAVVTSAYTEFLVIQPLPSNYLHSSFSFNISSSLSPDSRHYDILPRSLVQVARKARARTIELRFTRGRWNQEIWGALPHDGHRSGGTGIEIWANILANGEDAVDSWVELVNSLSGLFCASLNFIDSTRTVKPQLALRNAFDDGELFYGVLPSETVCTENLTPFLKLLPCKGHAGISSLLTGHKMFDTDWSSLAVAITFTGNLIEINQSVDMVFDLERALFASRDPIPGSQPSEELICQEGKHYTTDVTCFPKDGRLPSQWSFNQIFGKSLNGHCAVADQTSPSLLIHHGEEARLVPHTQTRIGNESQYTLQGEQMNLQVTDKTSPKILHAPIQVHRSLTSHGSSLHGKITLSVRNFQDRDVDIVYFTVLPWFMRPYLHSLRSSHENVILETLYRPAKDRIRPSHLELRLKIPSHDNVLITFDFDRTVLRIAEYPPDANRGFDVP